MQTIFVIFLYLGAFFVAECKRVLRGLVVSMSCDVGRMGLPGRMCMCAHPVCVYAIFSRMN